MHKIRNKAHLRLIRQLMTITPPLYNNGLSLSKIKATKILKGCYWDIDKALRYIKDGSWIYLVWDIEE